MTNRRVNIYRVSEDYATVGQGQYFWEFDERLNDLPIYCIGGEGDVDNVEIKTTQELIREMVYYTREERYPYKVTKTYEYFCFDPKLRKCIDVYTKSKTGLLERDIEALNKDVESLKLEVESSVLQLRSIRKSAEDYNALPFWARLFKKFEGVA
jgi:hypothetical protein